MELPITALEAEALRPPWLELETLYQWLAQTADQEPDGQYRNLLFRRLRKVEREILAAIPVEALERIGAADHRDLAPTSTTVWPSPTARATFAIAGDESGPPTAWTVGLRNAVFSREDMVLSEDGVWRLRRQWRRVQPEVMAAALGAGPPSRDQPPGSGHIIRLQMGGPKGPIFHARVPPLADTSRE